MAPGDLQEVLAALSPAGVPAHERTCSSVSAAPTTPRSTGSRPTWRSSRRSTSSRRSSTTRGRGARWRRSTRCRTSTRWAARCCSRWPSRDFPRDIDKTIITEVFRGGAEKVAEAGGVIAGGHTVVDAEPKYGLCVTGRVHPDRILIKGGLRRATGCSSPSRSAPASSRPRPRTRRRRPDVLEGAVASMLRLNRVGRAGRHASAAPPGRPTSPASACSGTPPRWSRPRAPAWRSRPPGFRSCRARWRWPKRGTFSGGHEAQPPPRRGEPSARGSRSIRRSRHRCVAMLIGSRDLGRAALLGRARSGGRRHRGVSRRRRGVLGGRRGRGRAGHSASCRSGTRPLRSGRSADRSGLAIGATDLPSCGIPLRLGSTRNRSN